MYIKKGEVITIAAGHSGSAGASYNGFKEEVLTKEVATRLTYMFSSSGISAYNVSPSGTGYTQSTQLKTEVNNANAYTTSKLHLCIHFNSTELHNAKGTESWIYSTGGNAEIYAKQITSEISSLGFSSRGVKISGTSLYVPRMTKAPCVLIEVCFIDSADDMYIYDLEKVCKAIFKAVTNEEFSSGADSTPSISGPTSDAVGVYRVVCGAYSNRENAEKKQDELKASGFDSFLDYVTK